MGPVVWCESVVFKDSNLTNRISVLVPAQEVSECCINQSTTPRLCATFWMLCTLAWTLCVIVIGLPVCVCVGRSLHQLSEGLKTLIWSLLSSFEAAANYPSFKH